MRLGVLISGRGSNLQALIDACAEPAYPAEIAYVVSNRADAAGLARATAVGIPVVVIPHHDPGEFAAAVDMRLRAAGVELVCLAGFMRLLETGFVEAWRDHMVNIHPSLLPAFPGLHPQRQALAAGVRFSGCTVHFVRPEVDTGPIIAQAVVPVRPDDDEGRLSARILAAEHGSIRSRCGSSPKDALGSATARSRSPAGTRPISRRSIHRRPDLLVRQRG